jgi:hypothetical protein
MISPATKDLIIVIFASLFAASIWVGAVCWFFGSFRYFPSGVAIYAGLAIGLYGAFMRDDAQLD